MSKLKLKVPGKVEDDVIYAKVVYILCGRGNKYRLGKTAYLQDETYRKLRIKDILEVKPWAFCLQ